MKKCPTCGNQNADDMRFCLNCGASLPDAPVIVNFGGSQGGQSNPGTNPYGQSMETQIGANRPGFQQPPPAFQQPQYSMAAQHGQRSGGGSKKILIAVGGVAFLFLLILGAGAAIVGYNMIKDKPVVTISPTPSVSPSGSPSASPSATKSASPTPKSTEEKNLVDDPKEPADSDMRATFDKIWVDYNVTQGGEKGMKIHVKFTVYNMKGVDSKLIVFFQKEDGTDLRNNNPRYSTKDGRVAAIRTLKPGFENTEYKDLDVFIPYTALSLPKGVYNLKMDADVAHDDETMIQHLGYHEFEFEQF